MQKTTTYRKPMTIAGCAMLLAAFLLMPLVCLMSYRWPVGDVLYKMPRLVSGDVSRTVGYVLLAGMLLSPVVLALLTGLKNQAAKVWHRLPVLFSVLLVVALLLSSKPVSPAIGLWLYLIVACALAAISFISNTNTE